MKKLFFLICILIIPFSISAKNYCKIISGNGKDIGSEIACGTEHFYVLSSDKNQTRMIAKYNLYTGYIINKIKIDLSEGYSSTFAFCDAKAEEMVGINKPYQGADTVEWYDPENYCYIQTEIKTDKMLQSDKAIGAHVDTNGKYLYPQVGDNYIATSNFLYDEYQPDVRESDENVEYSFDKFHDFKISVDNETRLGSKLLAYQQSLSEMGFQIDNIDLLSLSEIDKIIKNNTNKELPLTEWGESYASLNPVPAGGGATLYFVEAPMGNIKEYVPNNLKWLYSTTYWNKTIIIDNASAYGFFVIFVGSMGKICGAGTGYCGHETTLGCGIRPVITIPNEIEYLIKTITNGNGTIEVVENALGGESIQFKVSAKKGYVLNKLIVTTDSSEKVEFNKGKIIKNKDGTTSIDKNKFTMPFENVTIEAKFVPVNIVKNPETQSGLVILVIIILSITLLFININNKKEEFS